MWPSCLLLVMNRKLLLLVMDKIVRRWLLLLRRRRGLMKCRHGLQTRLSRVEVRRVLWAKVRVIQRHVLCAKIMDRRTRTMTSLLVI